MILKLTRKNDTGNLELLLLDTTESYFYSTADGGVNAKGWNVKETIEEIIQQIKEGGIH